MKVNLKILPIKWLNLIHISIRDDKEWTIYKFNEKPKKLRLENTKEEHNQEISKGKRYCFFLYIWIHTKNFLNHHV